MEPTHHDPRIKQTIKGVIYDQLYLPVQKRMTARLESLVQRNTLLGGFTHPSFYYKGTVYRIDDSPLPGLRNKLIKQLYPEMEEYLLDVKELNEKELPYVLGYVNRVLNATHRLSDYLKLLPESLHPSIQQLISTCPGNACELPEEKIKDILEKNQESIQLMKSRMVLNLLL